MVKVYGLSSGSLLVMLTVASRTPVALGLKRTWKVVVWPAPTGVLGTVTTLKSLAFGPLSATSGGPDSCSAARPLLLIVKVCVIAWLSGLLPKSVPSPADGLVSPSTITCPFPNTAMSGAGGVTVTTTTSGVGSARPKLSVTTRLKVSTAGAPGAVNVGWALVGFAKLTGGPPVWRQPDG